MLEFIIRYSKIKITGGGKPGMLPVLRKKRFQMLSILIIQGE